MRISLMSLSLCFVIGGCRHETGPVVPGDVGRAAATNPSPVYPWSQPSAVALGKCAFGHGELREIPIHYGLLHWTPELRRKADNLEFWPGGCVGGPSPIKVVCLTCRYAFDPLTRAWEKFGTDPDAFARPLSPLVRAIPVPVGGRPQYYQFWGPSGRVAEQLVCWSAEDQSATESRIARYIEGRGARVRREVREHPGRRYVNLSALVHDVAIDVELMFDRSVGETCLHFRAEPG